MRIRLRLLLRPSQKLKLKTRQVMLVGTFFLALIAGIVVFIFQFSRPDKSVAGENNLATFRSYQGLNFQKIVYTSDNGYLLSDGTNFIKMNSSGSVEWSKMVSSPYNMIITGLSQTNDGDFVTVCQSSDTSNYKIGVIRMKPQGSLKWFKVFSAKGSDFAYGIAADSDNGVILTGGGCNISHFIMKIDADGNANWMKDFGVTGTTGSAYKVLTDANKNLLVAGRITSNGNYFLSVLKTDEYGNFVWGKKISDTQLPIVKAFIQTSDGDYILAGTYIAQSGKTTNNPFVVKLDQNGNVIWFKRMGSGNYESINDLAPDEEGGVVAVGNIFLNETENVNALLLHLDATGNILWQKSAGNYELNGAGYDDAYSIARTSDVNYTVIGMAYWSFMTNMDVNGNGFCHQTPVSLSVENVSCQSMNIVFSQVPGQIFDAETISAASKNIFVSAPNSCSPSATTTSTEDVTVQKDIEVSLFPNPNDGNFNINYQLPAESKDGVLQIFDLSGKEVSNLQLPSFTHSVSLHLTDLTNGIYLYRISSGDNVLKKEKFVITK